MYKKKKKTMLQLIKEERKEKEEGRRKWKIAQGVSPCRILPGLASPDLVGSRRRPTVFFFFFFPVVGLADLFFFLALGLG
jgi:hypothetical protein